MTGQDYQEQAARSAAGHAALAMIEQHGLDMGATMLRGYAGAFLVAYAAVVGWEEAGRLINELSTGARVPRADKKPKLVVVNQ